MKLIPWDDLVFTNRNRSYGAYVLRKEYHGALAASVVIMLLVMTVLIVTSPVFFTFVGKIIESDQAPKIVLKVIPPEDLVQPIVKTNQPILNVIPKELLPLNQAAEFPGGTIEFNKFIQSNIKYPASARSENIQGRVFVSFIVDVDGTIKDVETVRSLSTDCDKEAERVISQMPHWCPGKQQGVVVKMRIIFPVRFKL